MTATPSPEIAGALLGEITIGRLTRNGTLDGSFGDGGLIHMSGHTVDTVVGGHSGLIAFQRSGPVVVTFAPTKILRLSDGGDVLSSTEVPEESDGELAFEGATPDQILVQPDDSILLVASTGLDGFTRPVVFKLDPQGNLDRSFGSNGRTVVVIGEEGTGAAIGRQSDGKIIVASHVRSGGTQVARLLGAASAGACGDIDGNGSVSVSDGVQVLRAAVSLPSSCTLATCDVDGDGQIGVGDGVNVLRAAAGLSGSCAG